MNAVENALRTFTQLLLLLLLLLLLSLITILEVCGPLKLQHVSAQIEFNES